VRSLSGLTVDCLWCRSVKGLHLPQVSSIAHVCTHFSSLGADLGARIVDLLTGLLEAQLWGVGGGGWVDVKGGGVEGGGQGL
jgi:hypothetical protein